MRPALKEPKAQPDHRVHKVSPVLQDHKAQQVLIQQFKAQLVLQVPLVTLAQPAQQVLIRLFLAQPVLLVRLV